jgi:hypothetical protein
VYRPTTLTDFLGALNQQTSPPTTDVINGLSGFAEVDEAATVSGSMTATHSAPPGWAATTWGAFLWA